MADRHDAIVPFNAIQDPKTCIWNAPLRSQGHGIFSPLSVVSTERPSPYSGSANAMLLYMLSSASAQANVSVPDTPFRFWGRVSEVSHTH